MTTTELSALAQESLRIAQEATPGPWRDDNGYRVYGPDEEHGCLFETKHFAASVGNDCTFAAHFRTAGPLLAQAVLDLAKKNEELRADRDRTLNESFELNASIASAFDFDTHGKTFAESIRELRARIVELERQLVDAKRHGM